LGTGELEVPFGEANGYFLKSFTFKGYDKTKKNIAEEKRSFFFSSFLVRGKDEKFFVFFYLFFFQSTVLCSCF